MNFNTYSDLAGKHAFLSPSSYHWLNYDDEKLDHKYISHLAAQKGTRLHALAHDLIREGIKLPDNGTTLSSYVNDAIGYRLTPEQPLYYSANCFGTPDAIGFKDNLLRIHDLKTGVNEASMQQLMVYAALFCLEYNYTAFELKIELRIYQNDAVAIYEPEIDETVHVIEKIVYFNKRIDTMRSEVL